MIHQYKLGGYNIVLDIASGAVHAVDDIAYDIIAMFESKNKEDVPAEVKAFAEQRLVARANKDWAKSDELRDKIAELGYLIKDSKDGYTLSKK